MKRSRGFSLPELMIAMLFISIAFFAYAALQQRLIYSSWRMEQRVMPRENARSDFNSKYVLVRTGSNKLAEQVPETEPGLFYVRGNSIWIDTRSGGKQNREYNFDSIACQARQSSW